MAPRTLPIYPVNLGLALQQGWQGLWANRWDLVGFSLTATALHLLGWALFAAGHDTGSGILNALLRLVGVPLYFLSLLWLIQGLTRGGLDAAAGHRPRWRELCRWSASDGLRLGLSLLTAAAGLALAALIGFVGWSLVIFLAPALSVVAILLALVLLGGVALSQVFNACLVLGVEAQGSVIQTIEGLQPSPDTLHPLQHSFMQHGAAQCGFCTPGILMMAKALLDENPAPSEQEIRFGLAGNICRCTGYTKIIDAVSAAARQLRGEAA
jgi:aerobic-type carbon monoxide dehydrogenase small subunit (CoxS/CutS family)